MAPKRIILLVCSFVNCYSMQNAPTKHHGQFLFSPPPQFEELAHTPVVRSRRDQRHVNQLRAKLAGDAKSKANLFDAMPGELKERVIGHALLNYITGHKGGFYPFRTLCKDTQFGSEMAFKPRREDEEVLTCGGYNGKVGMWDAVSGELKSELMVFPDDTAVSGLAYSPDGQELACQRRQWGAQSADVFTLVDMTTSGQRVVTVPGQNGYACSFSYDQQQLVYSRHGNWDGARWSSGIFNYDTTHNPPVHTAIKLTPDRSFPPDAYDTPEGLKLIHCGGDGHIQIADVAGRVLHNAAIEGFDKTCTVYTSHYNLPRSRVAACVCGEAFKR